MQRSTHRILTTHCGSLPRPNDLLAMLMAREQGGLQDMHAFHTRVRAAIVGKRTSIVALADAGITFVALPPLTVPTVTVVPSASASCGSAVM